MRGQNESKAGTPSPERLGSLTIDPNDFEVRCILGTPCFVCGGLAQILRKGGAQIDRRAESEQAHVITWMLTKWQAHGATWKTEADKELKALYEANTGRQVRRDEEKTMGNSIQQSEVTAGTPSPERLGSEIVRVARKVAGIARNKFDADQQLKRLMTARYGDHDEMPDSIVEAVEYGGGDKDITLTWIDAEMIAAGYHPNT